jgi:hypothetical protein
MVDELVNEQNLLPPTVLPIWRKVMQQTTDMSQQAPAPGSIAAFRADAIEVSVQAKQTVVGKKKQRGGVLIESCNNTYFGSRKTKTGEGIDEGVRGTERGGYAGCRAGGSVYESASCSRKGCREKGKRGGRFTICVTIREERGHEGEWKNVINQSRALQV